MSFPLNDPNKKPDNIQDELVKKNENTSRKKLAFDPETGELMVKNSENDPKKAPNEVIVDHIYNDGFFNLTLI